MHNKQVTESAISGPVGGVIVTSETSRAAVLGAVLHYVILGAIVAAVIALAVTR